MVAALVHLDFLHEPPTPVYGYEVHEQMPPFEMIQPKALSIRPPLQPWSAVSQSTSSWGESELRPSPSISTMPSIEAQVEKAQHEPHCSWFLMGVTAPLVTQLTEVGRVAASPWKSKTLPWALWLAGTLVPR
eukprot:Amastigsp_a676280_1700.p3 type:complete len:132 gc:universal Amastigsp_a676280_1700:341-736(+)